MDWHDSDGSEDGDTQAASRKRSSRACDQCRKTKSKCEKGVGEGTPCKSCTLAGTTCTFLGPSYKRGPPKESLPLLPLFDPPSLPPPVQGYIHAIEQRWHQVESLLGVVLQCTDPRVQGVVADLRQDDLAREILNRVDMGPYGPTGRRYQSQGATKEDFFASVLRSNGVTPGLDSSRSRRQSRVSREKVSLTQDRGLSIVPTAEWQDNLAARLSSSPSTSTSYIAPSSSSDGPIVQRRRLDSTPTDSQPDWNEMYTLADPEEPVDITEGIGELSLTENQEIRYHGKASGLHFLSKDNRTDDRVEGGVWKMPMARVWPPSKDFAVHSIQEDEIEVELPPPHVQDHLVELYFTYIHPVFPVIHKGRFLSEYSARREGQARENSPYSTSSSPKPESSQKCTNLLLLTIFSITARFCDDQPPNPPATINQMWEAGHQHLEQARKILTKIFDRSRPSTVQSLLLLGYREFGIGSMEQGWIYIGMAIRMAVDLGLHRNSDQWKHHGHNLFSKDEVQTRRQIWWCCCLGDRYGSTYMGRPIVIRDEDFDTPLPEIQEEDDLELWQPSASDLLNIRPYAPVPCHVIACLRKTGELIVVLGRIVSKLYPIAATDLTPKRAILQTLEVQLDQWYITLPEHLRYDVASKRGQVPPPHIIFIHIRYWGAILLLNRAFIPNWTEVDFASPRSTLESKALDLSQSAATHLSALVTVWRETFSLKRCSPFLTSYMLSTGIMHLLTLRLRPSNPQAAHGLRQCLDALEDMAVLWPSASRARDLLSGVRVGVSDFMSRPSNASKLKRHVDDAFGHDDNAEYVQREALREGPQQVPTHAQVAHRTGQDGVQDFSQRIMAHMLGLDVPGVEPSTSLYPGYEWWPRPGQSQGPATLEGHMAQHPSSFSQVSANINPQMRNSGMDTYNSPVAGWMPDGGMMTNASNTVPEYSNYPYNYTQYGL